MEFIRIVHVITRSDTIGGAQVHVRQLAQALRAQGHDVVVLTGGHGPFLEQLQSDGIPVESVPHLIRTIRPLTDWRAVWELRWYFKRLQPDLVALHSSKAGWLGRMAASSLGIPVVFTAHGWAFTEGVGGFSRTIYKLAERLMAPLARRIITVSNYDRNLALRFRIAPESKLVTVRNGVPYATGGRAIPSADPCRIIMVARLDHPKDQASLVRALGELRHLDWQADLVGDGPKRAQLEQLIADLRLQCRIRLLGNREDVQPLLAQSGLFVLISHFEGLPLSILEAMRMGLPIVASEVGGVPELVREGSNGYLIPRGDQDRLRDRLEALLTSPELRERLGEASFRFCNTHTEEQMVSQTLAVYQEALQRA